MTTEVIAVRAPWVVWFLIGIDVHERGLVEKYVGRKQLPVCMLSLLCGEVACKMNPCVVGVRNEHYGILPLYYLAAALGIIGILGVSRCIDRNRILEYIGRNSLVVLGFHKFPILLFQEMLLFTKMILNTPDTLAGLLLGCLVTVVSIAICLLINIYIMKIAPWLIGKGTK